MEEHDQNVWVEPIITTLKRDNNGIIDLANAINAWGEAHLHNPIVGWDVASTYGTFNAMVMAELARLTPLASNAARLQAVPIVGTQESNDGYRYVADEANKWVGAHPKHRVEGVQILPGNGTINALLQVYGEPVGQFHHK